VPGLRYLAPGTGFGSAPRAGYRAPRNEPNAPTGYASCNPASVTDKALGRGPFIPRSDSAGWVPAWTLGKWLFVPTEAESAVSNRFDSLHISESYADWPKTVQGVESAGQSVYFCRHGGRPNGSPDPGHFRSVGASDPSGTGFAGGIPTFRRPRRPLRARTESATGGRTSRPVGVGGRRLSRGGGPVVPAVAAGEGPREWDVAPSVWMAPILHTPCVGFSKHETGIPPGARYRVPGIRSGTWDLVPGTGAESTPKAGHRAPRTEPGHRKTRTPALHT
jgi:hypothetical protein